MTYNSITSTQSVTFTVTGPTPTPTPTGVEAVSIDYSYDPLYRLTRASYSGSLAASYAYGYDAVGNRLTQNANGALTTYGYDIANRLTSANGQSYTWDNNGNLLSDGLLTYTYDQANRLRTVVQGGSTYTFAYNGVGDRLSQTVGITTTRYVLDPAAGLTQVLADGTNTFLYGAGRIAQYQAVMQYFGADGLGSVRQLYDASAMVLANNRYDPYGNVMSQSGATTVFAFAGEQQDATGLTFLRARYYSAAQGRFTTRDVWEGDPASPMSYNAWSYVYGNAVNLTDHSGRIPANPSSRSGPGACPDSALCYYLLSRGVMLPGCEGVEWGFLLGVDPEEFELIRREFLGGATYQILKNNVDAPALGLYLFPPVRSLYDQSVTDLEAHLPNTVPFLGGRLFGSVLGMVQGAAEMGGAPYVTIGGSVATCAATGAQTAGAGCAAGVTGWTVGGAVIWVHGAAVGVVSAWNGTKTAISFMAAREPGPQNWRPLGQDDLPASYKPPKGGPRKVVVQYGPRRGSYGWLDAKGDIWVPAKPTEAHGGPHWDVQIDGGRGGYYNELPRQ